MDASRGLGALLLATMLFNVNAAAQFGTQVRPGDSDYVPVTNRASLVVRVNEADLGQPGVVADNCLLLDTGST
ncbi:MAG TPA: hypothetical protein VNB23_08180, partial [Ramlibacter sp.]|nr:hypothetical protein [Ramlibacter sp.]